MRAFYELDGEVARPAELTRGPWDAAAQHGGAPAALLARQVEREEGDGLWVARLTIEFLRPVPLHPLRVSSRVVRPGRRVQLVEAELEADGRTVARATALRIRASEAAAPEVGHERGVPPGPEGAEPVRTADMPITRPWFGEDGVEVRFASGGYAEAGPAVAWFRLRVPVVAGEEASPLERAVCAADFGNGVSAALDWHAYVFINPDLTVYLERPPRGEWVCLDARTTVDPNGVGLTRADLFDGAGPLGQATQALFVAPR